MTESPQGGRGAARRRLRVAITCAFGVCLLAAVGLGSASGQALEGSPAVLLGYGAVQGAAVALIVWLTLYFGVLRKAVRKPSPLGLLIVLALISSLTSLISVSVSEHAALAHDKVLVDAALGNFQAACVRDSQDYQAQLQSHHIADFFGPDSDLNHHRYAQAQRTLAQVRSVIDDHRSLFALRVAQLKGAIGALPISDSEKRQINAGIESSVARRQADIDYYWSTQYRVIEQYAKLVTIDARSLSNPYARPGFFLFSSSRDVNEFNSLKAGLVTLQYESQAAADNLRQASINLNYHR